MNNSFEDSEAPDVVREEERNLSRICEILELNPEHRISSERQTVEHILALRDEINTAKAEDLPSLYEQMNQSTAILEQLRASQPTSSVNPSSPYFAHIQICEEGKMRDIYIGQGTRLSHGLRIVDWRNAPISRIYYRYEVGDEYEEEIGGKTKEGEVVFKRNLFIHHSELLRVSDHEATYLKQKDSWIEQKRGVAQLAGGEGAALRAGSAASAKLGQGAALRASKLLPDIAALIDADQFELITSKQKGALVIRGSAGSGKTTVTLHRIAYLVYDKPQRFRPHRMMFIVWGKAMKDYVSHVLPALGVSGVQVQTWGKWSAKMVQKHFPELTKSYAYNTPPAVTKIKLSPSLLMRLTDTIARNKGPSTAYRAMEDWAEVITDFDAIRSEMKGILSEGELKQAISWLTKQHRDYCDVQDGLEDVGFRLDVEDCALLLRAHQLRVGPLHRGKGQNRAPLSLSHLAIDEVQDFSPVEILVLLDVCDSNRCVTLAGDTRQHISKDSGFSSWTEFLDEIGIEQSSLSTLDISYRSTHPIVRFAQNLLEDDDEPLPQTLRDGPEVEIFEFSNVGACVGFLSDVLTRLILEEPLANIALIAPNAELAEAYAAGLTTAEVDDVRLVLEQNFSFAPGIDVVPALDVKGLEFDYVVILDATAEYFPDTSHHRRLLHVAATRAVHQLWVTVSSRRSPILPDII